MKVKMSKITRAESLAVKLAPITLALAGVMAAPSAEAVLLVQCPGDANGDALVDSTGATTGDVDGRDINCIHIGASDGYAKMADGRNLYFFSFHQLNDVNGSVVDAAGAPEEGQLRSNLPSPTIVGKEGQELYLTLSNVGMALRPDLPDAHTVHYHGFPQASTIMDGVPDVSVSPNSMASMTYYYNLVEPGTYIYHCHFEATEHMQMGMIGNLWVTPAQNDDPDRTFDNGFAHVQGNKYVYNDNDGSTRYDVEYPIQIIAFDGDFHDASEMITALPFADMNDEYPMINGRGYPDTVQTDTSQMVPTDPDTLEPLTPQANDPVAYASQQMHSIVTAAAGQRILLRVTNVSIINAFTLTAPGLTMELVGRGARVYRAANGENLHQRTSQVTVAGGDGFDVIINTEGVAPGTYFLYTTNLNFLSNNTEDNGGIMTEIRIEPAV